MTGWLADPVLQSALHGAFALLFAAAAGHKWRDLRGFESALADYALLPPRALATTARALPLLEVGLAFSLLGEKLVRLAPGLSGGAGYSK